MVKNRISILIATFLIIGFFFLAFPEKGYSGIPFGCCKTPDNGTSSCIGCESGCATSQDFCNSQNGDFTDSFEICIDEGGALCDPTNPQLPGCCIMESGDCMEDIEFQTCFDDREFMGEIWFDSTCAGVPQCAPAPIPTFNQWGLIVLAGILGIVGFMVIRRKKVSA